jgi:hypothetical protein
LEDILKTTSKGKQIDIALLDFSKAFDKVPHQRLNNKLNVFGIHDNTLNWISSFLHNRTQLVILDNVKSSTTTVESEQQDETRNVCLVSSRDLLMIAVEDVVYKLVKTRRLIQEQDIETIPSKLPGKVMKLKIHEVRPYLDEDALAALQATSKYLFVRNI